MPDKPSTTQFHISSDNSPDDWLECEGLDDDLRDALSVALRVLDGASTWTISEERIRQRRKASEQSTPITKKEHDTENIKVKQLWHKALSRRLLSLKTPVFAAKAQQLVKEFNRDEFAKPIEFVVADDLTRPGQSDVLYHAAARVLAKRIEQLLNETNESASIGICSGRTLSRTIKFLEMIARPSDDSAKRLTFVGLNTAYLTEEYKVASNYLAVRLAEIYGSRYLTVPVKWPVDGRMQLEHRTAVENMSLLVTAAGTTNGFLFRWYQDFTGTPLIYPPGTVGDIGFLPINDKGESPKLLKNVRDVINTHLQQFPSFEHLKDLAAKGRVLVVLADIDSDDDKTRVALAILMNRLASHCVLGARLAESVLKLKCSPPNN